MDTVGLEHVKLSQRIDNDPRLVPGALRKIQQVYLVVGGVDLKEHPLCRVVLGKLLAGKILQEGAFRADVDHATNHFCSCIYTWFFCGCLIRRDSGNKNILARDQRWHRFRDFWSACACQQTNRQSRPQATNDPADYSHCYPFSNLRCDHDRTHQCVKQDQAGVKGILHQRIQLRDECGEVILVPVRPG